MVDYLVFHAAELTICASLMLIVFILARLNNAGMVLALAIATTPMILAWAFLTPAGHGFVAQVLGAS